MHLLPGEETSLGLKLVNQDAPASLSLEACGPIVGAVSPEKKDHYVAGEEMIQIRIRMPDVERLEGALLLSGSGGNGNVPVTLIRDAEGIMSDTSGLEERMEFIDEEDVEEESEEEEGEEGIQSADHEDVEDLEDTDRSAQEEQEDVSSIRFSKEKDLERYRASKRRDRPADQKAAHYNEPGYGCPSEDAQSYERAEFVEEEQTSPSADNKALSSLFDLGSDKSTLLAVPAAMLVALIALLVLTFYSESIPEFTGALASSMLIITLIIYGAATLLKA
jgi:hypothetical protein